MPKMHCKLLESFVARHWPYFFRLYKCLTFFETMCVNHISFQCKHTLNSNFSAFLRQWKAWNLYTRKIVCLSTRRLHEALLSLFLRGVSEQFRWKYCSSHTLRKRLAVKQSMLFFLSGLSFSRCNGDYKVLSSKYAITYVDYMERKLIGHIYIKCVNSRA